MYAVGKVGTFFAQSVYTVSGPFHPFGGAVDIIVVQQEDGTFKSSPWYVKFGKFQGVLKRREKKVVVAVNDGDANFHMYLDHKGEAYFLKDAPQGDDEVATFSPTEAASSGDEISSSHMLALEYPRVVEEGAHPQVQHGGKEESEDEKGDDLELRFEGRDASKQLIIQQSVEERMTAGFAAGDDARDASQGNYSGDDEIRESPRAAEEEEILEAQPKSPAAGRTAESGNGKVMHALLNKAIGLEEGVKSTPASATLANAALTALQSSSSSFTEDTFPKQASTKVRRTASNNGVIIHGLLNQVIGLQPSHKPGPASGLMAAAVLASLRKVVSDSQADVTESTPHHHVELVELDEGADFSDAKKNHEDANPGSPVGEQLQEEVPKLDSSSNPNAASSTSGTTSDVVEVMKTVRSLGSLSGSEIDQPEEEGPIHSNPISPSRPAEFFDVMKTLEVRKVEILDKTLVVEVKEHIGKENLGSRGKEEEEHTAEADGRVESIVVDRKEVTEKVHDLQCSSVAGGIPSKDAQDPELAYEAKKYEEASKLVSVHVDKRFVENLQEALSPKIAKLPELISEKDKLITTPGDEILAVSSENAQDVRRPDPVTPGQELPVVSRVVPSTGHDGARGDNAQEIPTTLDVRRPDAATPGQELPVDIRVAPSTNHDGARGDNTQEASTTGKELALVNPVNVSDDSSPRMKAAIELELAWREVMEKAVTALKGAPYSTSKKLSHSQSYKNKGLESGDKKPGSKGRLPQQQSEKKSWGGWLWGGSSAPPSKQTNEQGGSKDGKSATEELSMESLDLGTSSEIRDASVVTSGLEDVTKGGTRSMQDVEASGNHVEAEEKGSQSDSDSGATQGRRASSDNCNGKGKPEGPQLDSLQQKGPGGPPPPRRRTLFGLLSRTSTNQSSLSTSSSLRSNEDDLQPIFDGLKRVTSLERADNVVDLLEETWAKGSEAHRARILGGKIAIQEPDKTVDGAALEGSILRAALENADDIGNFPASVEAGDGLKGDGSSQSNQSTILETSAGAEGAVTQQTGSLTAEDTMIDLEDSVGNQQVIKVTSNGSEIVTTSTSLESDNDPVDVTSTSDMDVLLLSVNGHLVRAPVGVGSNEATLLADDVVKTTRRANSPQKLVCFADVSDERPSVSPDARSSARNGVQGMEPGTAAQLSASALDESDDASDGKPSNPSYEGLKGLANLVEHDSVGGAEQQEMGSFKRVVTESAPNQLVLHAESGETVQMNDRNESVIDRDATDPKEFDDMGAMVFETLEETLDGDDLDDEKIERFYSSKDLTEVEDEEEKRAIKLKRNLSIYMDAISGEDEQDSAGSAHEDEIENHSRDRSGPIGIPGAVDWPQVFPSEKEMLLRSVSESLPNTRNNLVTSEMMSPRLLLSRSLDSASPSVLSPETRQLSTSSDGGLPARPSVRSPVSSLGKEVVEALSAVRTPEKRKEDLEQQREGLYEPRTHGSTAASSSSSVDDGTKDPETGFELSLCRHLLKERMGLEAAAQAFASEKITLAEFKKSGSTVAANDKLVVRVGGCYYPWVVAAPIVLGILAFGQVLVAPNEGAIAVEQPIVVFDGKVAAITSTAISGGGWKLWPFGAIRRPKTPERGALLSREAMMVATEVALKSTITEEYLRMAGYYKRPRKVRTNSPSSQQLASLNLKEGSNRITFTFETRVLGKQQVDARIYLWKWNARIVISDVDGTITRSDVLGQVMPLMGKDWTQIGVARLFSAIKKNGYELMFLSARAISQAYLTRHFLENIKQDGEALPDGPVVISPDGLFPSLYREVIRRAPHEFKIACLEDIKSLFHPESKPFYAGFGNRDTDELSYLKVGISKGKIFIINPKGEVVVNNQVDVKSYTSLHKLVDDMFPAVSFTEQEDYNEWNFWKLPLPDVDDEASVKSVGSSSSWRSGNKSGRRS